MARKDPSARAAYQRAYRIRRREELNAYMSAYKRRRYAEDPTYRESVKAAARNVPHNVKTAQQRVHLAVKRGWLIRPTACEKCGASCRPEAAHTDYSRPLDVRWLCQSCHRRWDLASPKSGTGSPPPVVRRQDAYGRFMPTEPLDFG